MVLGFSVIEVFITQWHYFGFSLEWCKVLISSTTLICNIMSVVLFFHCCKFFVKTSENLLEFGTNRTKYGIPFAIRAIIVDNKELIHTAIRKPSAPVTVVETDIHANTIVYSNNPMVSFGLFV